MLLSTIFSLPACLQPTLCDQSLNSSATSSSAPPRDELIRPTTSSTRPPPPHDHFSEEKKVEEKKDLGRKDIANPRTAGSFPPPPPRHFMHYLLSLIIGVSLVFTTIFPPSLHIYVLTTGIHVRSGFSWVSSAGSHVFLSDPPPLLAIVRSVQGSSDPLK
ncbi:uncharacterized protein LOC122297081 [Carya illinoinensis]|uniref:uncharacterized protein LOC122297081 n=1 Tax=Carya illinoinensis TaxID=32201 RepID=UPI001C719AC3|nr:uncharacterized protein LOC122297081 [Carya illinoinensis]